MALEARIGQGYAWRMIIIAIVCLVLGAWGVYDFAVDIPRRQLAAERLALLEQCRTAMEREQPAGTITPETEAARQAAQAEIGRLVELHVSNVVEEAEVTTPEDLRRVLNSAPMEVTEQDMASMQLLTSIVAGLGGERSLPLSGDALRAYEGIQEAIEITGAVVAPAKYDRIMQWGFILCLPCTPYLLWMWWRVRKIEYRLDEDSTLHMPEGTWQTQDIDDIDMSKWMGKSIATVQHRDGTRVQLDDYKFKDLYLIIGAVANRLHPDDWTDQAKPIKDDQASGDETEAGDKDSNPEPADAPSAPVDA